MRSINVYEHVNVSVAAVICSLLLVASTVDPVVKYNIYTFVHALQIRFENRQCGHKWLKYERIV